MQLLAVLNPDLVEVDPEEGYNAGHAFALLNGHADALFALQYRPFCGGCTLDAALAVPLFAALGPTWLAWKLVPIGFSLLLLLVGFARLPAPARWAWALLLLLPSHAWLSLSLVAWGNHYEAACLSAVGLLLLRAPRRPLLAGVSLGAAVWVSFSGLFALPAALLWLAWTERRAVLRLLPGVALGMSPWLLQWLLAGTSPFGEIYGQGEASPSLSHLPTQLATLAHPRQLAALLGHPALGLGGLAAVPAVLAGLVLAARSVWGRLVLLAALSWAGTYLLSGFHIPIPEAPSLPEPASLRYMAPLLPLVFLALAESAGALWASGRRGWAGALLAAPLLVGLVSRAAVFSDPFPAPQAARMLAPDLPYFREQARYMLDRTEHRACRSDHPRERAVHGHALGYERATIAFRGNPTPAYALMGFQALSGVDEPSFYAGAAVALIDSLDADGQATVETLAEALAVSERWGAAASQEMLRTRRYAPWLSVTDGHDEDALRATQAALVGAPAELWWLVGLRWGEDSSRPLVASPVALPVLTAAQEAAIPEAFAEGLGAAMGGQWGPIAPPLPQNLPPAWEAAFVAGYSTGVSRRW